jgi:hypothetical protein
VSHAPPAILPSLVVDRDGTDRHVVLVRAEDRPRAAADLGGTESGKDGPRVATCAAPAPNSDLRSLFFLTLVVAVGFCVVARLAQRDFDLAPYAESRRVLRTNGSMVVEETTWRHPLWPWTWKTVDEGV